MGYLFKYYMQNDIYYFSYVKADRERQCLAELEVL